MKEQEIRAALKALTDGQLRCGMKAFTHPPRKISTPVNGDSAGCFCYEAFGEGAYWRNDNWQRYSLSVAYESYTELFRGECIRELAERGVAVEPALAAP